jgi:CubicO group peptidase (beta-lactamase class C family)
MSILLAAAASAVLLTGVHALEQHAAPESEGFSAERLARIGPVMRAEIEKGTMPGAVTLIARHGRVVHVDAYGYLDSGKTKPMTTDAVFRLFSMTKPFVSVEAMMLVEQGQMKLSDPISTWLPELKEMKVLTERKDAVGNITREPVPAERLITVQDLLRHTSGFIYINNAPSPELKEAYTKAGHCQVNGCAKKFLPLGGSFLRF